MDKRVFCVISLCTLALNCSLASSNQAKIDSYVDAIIADANKQVLDNQQEPLPLRNFTFKIAKTGISNRDVKANITLGRFEGLSKLYRRRPCRLSVPPQAKGRTDLAPVVNITINCNVTLSGVKAIIINGEFKGDSLSGTVKKFSTLTNVNTADMNVTFVGRPGLKGYLTQAKLNKMVLTTSFPNSRDKPDLNKERLTKFIDELNHKLNDQLFDFASTRYKKFLNNATSRKVIPYLV